MNAYLSQRQRKTKLGSTFSKHMSILFSVAQGSILRPLLSIIYICDLFILNDNLEFGSYADDTTPFIYGENIDEILGDLKKHMLKFLNGFYIIVLKPMQRNFTFS